MHHQELAYELRQLLPAVKSNDKDQEQLLKLVDRFDDGRLRYLSWTINGKDLNNNLIFLIHGRKHLITVELYLFLKAFLLNKV